MKTETFYLPGLDNLELFVYKWIPDTTEIQGVLQLTHGSLEHAKRYEHWAEFLTQRGFMVYALDQRGHGKTSEKNGIPLLFDESPGGWEKNLQEVYLLTQKIKEENPELPIFHFGHSMGSYLVRHYITQYGQEIDGAIIMGTGYTDPLLKPGFALLNFISLFGKKARKMRSKFFHYAIYGQLNSRMKKPKTQADFISRDEKEVAKYLADPYCQKIVTIDYARELVKGVLFTAKPSTFEQAPKDLPLLLISGEEDPVGNMGKGPKIIYELYKKVGVKNISLKLYPEARHELLNEMNKDDVMQDILAWMNKIQIMNNV